MDKSLQKQQKRVNLPFIKACRHQSETELTTRLQVSKAQRKTGVYIKAIPENPVTALFKTQFEAQQTGVIQHADVDNELQAC